MAATSLVLFGCLSSSASAQIQPWDDTLYECAYQAPDRIVLGATDVDVYPGGYRIVGGAFTPVAKYPLVAAVGAAEAVFLVKGTTVVLEVHGSIPAPAGYTTMQFGGGDAGLKAYRTHWTTAPMNFAVRGATGVGTDRITPFALAKNLNDGTFTHGVKKARFENLSITNLPGLNSTISTGMNLQPSSHGKYPKLQVFDCRFERGEGNPIWGARLHGRTKFDFRRNHFECVVEHCLYADSPQGDSQFVDNTMDCATRTMVQIVNRNAGDGKPSGFGYLLFEGNVARGVDFDGGADFTVAGHLGTVIFRDNRSIMKPEQVGSQGSITVWTDAGKGVYYNANGYSTNMVIVEDHTVNHPNADRDHIAISGVEDVRVLEDFTVIGNRTAFSFNDPFGGPIQNGTMCFGQAAPLSAYNGWQSGNKIKVFGVQKTDPQIDAFGAGACDPCY